MEGLSSGKDKLEDIARGSSSLSLLQVRIICLLVDGIGEFGERGVRCGSEDEVSALECSLRAPLTVTRTFRDPARSRCSHSQTPCQVPRLSFPSDSGTVKLEPRKQALTCAGCK